MKQQLFAAAFSAVLAVTATAQISGSINRGAPTVASAITMGTNKLEVSYTSIRFGTGEWQEILKETDQHEEFNKAAEGRPIGSVKTNAALMVAGKEIPAGDYSMFFTAHAQAGWILNLKPAKGEAIRWRLALTDSSSKSTCLKISLEPSAESDTCSITVAFGAQSVTVPVKIAGEKKKA